MGSLKIVNCQPKSLLDRLYLLDILLNPQGDDFGISGYIPVELISIAFKLSFERLVIIDVAV